jgi:hypothetical protein
MSDALKTAGVEPEERTYVPSQMTAEDRDELVDKVVHDLTRVSMEGLLAKEMEALGVPAMMVRFEKLFEVMRFYRGLWEDCENPIFCSLASADLAEVEAWVTTYLAGEPCRFGEHLDSNWDQRGATAAEVAKSLAPAEADEKTMVAQFMHSRVMLWLAAIAAPADEGKAVQV